MVGPRIPFTPHSASINRIRVMDLPGLNLDDCIRGKQAYNLLSAPAIVKYALAYADDLDLPSHLLSGDPRRLELRRDIPLYLSNSLASTNQKVRVTAHEIASQLGRNLGFLIITLHRGDEVNRCARKDWDDKDWEDWRHIRNIRIGGGIVSGNLGDAIITTAQQVLKESGYSEVLTIQKSHHQRSMSLLGASRYFSHNVNKGLCLDFGQTSVKAAVVHISQDVIYKLSSFPIKNVRWRWHNDPEAKNDIDPGEVVDFVTEHIYAIWTAAVDTHTKPHHEIMISIAAYVEGEKLLGNGLYAQMSLISRDVSTLLTQEIKRKYQIETYIKLIHDGTAAGAIHAGEMATAVLVFGTAIGVGFAPKSSSELLTIHPDIYDI